MAHGAFDLDVVTINLWGDNGPAGARMDHLAAWLRRERPDLVLVQEVEHVDGRGQGDLLAAAAGFPHADVVRTGRDGTGGEGLAVLSRHPLASLPLAPLPLARGDHPRALQRVDVAAPAGAVRVANTHLAWRLDATDARLAQVRAALHALETADRPVVLGGDLNDVPDSAPLRALQAAGFADCCAHDPGITFDRGNAYLWQPELAGRRIDHVLARGLEVLDAHVVLDGSRGPIVSDHYGVRATLRPPDATAPVFG